MVYAMPKKPNYNFEKRRKELDRKAKKDAKRADRQQRNERRDENAPTQSDSTPDDAANPRPPEPTK